MPIFHERIDQLLINNEVVRTWRSKCYKFEEEPQYNRIQENCYMYKDNLYTFHYSKDSNSGDYNSNRGDAIVIRSFTEPVELSDEEALKLLRKESPEIIRKYYPNAHYIVTRSSKPSSYPWKRFGRRTYCWVVPLEDRDKDRGRRLEWGGDTVLFKNRKEALNNLYKK